MGPLFQQDRWSAAAESATAPAGVWRWAIIRRGWLGVFLPRASSPQSPYLFTAEFAIGDVLRLPPPETSGRRRMRPSADGRPAEPEVHSATLPMTGCYCRITESPCREGSTGIGPPASLVAVPSLTEPAAPGARSRARPSASVNVRYMCSISQLSGWARRKARSAMRVSHGMMSPMVSGPVTREPEPGS